MTPLKTAWTLLIAAACAQSISSAGDLSGALHEQLGLELEPGKRPVEVLVLSAAHRQAAHTQNQVTE